MTAKHKYTKWAVTLLFATTFSTAGGCRRHSESATREAQPGKPLLVWSWWRSGEGYFGDGGGNTGAGKKSPVSHRQDWRDAGAMGFLSPSEALILLPSGLVCAGRLGGSPMYRFNSAVTMRLLAGEATAYLTGDRPRSGGTKVRRFRGGEELMRPNSLPMRKSWRDIQFHGCGAVSMDGRFASAAAKSTASNCVVLWSLATPNTPWLLLTKRAFPAGTMAFSPSGKRLAVGYDTTAAVGPHYIVWDTRSRKEISTPHRPNWWPGCTPAAIVFLPHGKLAVAGNGQLSVIDLNNEARPGFIPMLDKASATGPLIYNAAKQELLCAVENPKGLPGIYVCTAGGYPLHRIALRFFNADLCYITALARSGHARGVIVALNTNVDGGIGFFCEVDIANGRMVWRSPDIIGGCTSIAVSPDGRAAITGGSLGAELWRLPVAAPRR